MELQTLDFIFRYQIWALKAQCKFISQRVYTLLISICRFNFAK